MKRKLVLAALIFASALFGSIAFPTGRAIAVSCSSPYTFTNGTAADANQVNAVVQALITCIGNAVSSVTAGSNIVVTGTTTAPIVAVTAAPTFTGQVTAVNLDAGASGYVKSGARTSTDSYVPPVFNGSSLSPTNNDARWQVGTFQITLNANCAAETSCTPTGAPTITGAGAVQYCYANVEEVASIATPFKVDINTGTFVLFNTGGTTQTSGSVANIQYACLVW